jgi:hypothetical protein
MPEGKRKPSKSRPEIETLFSFPPPELGFWTSPVLDKKHAAVESATVAVVLKMQPILPAPIDWDG